MTDARRDPRTERVSDEHGVMPIVQRPSSGPSGLAITIGAVLAAVVLFVILDSRRRSLSVPAVVSHPAEAIGSTAPPPLYIPPTPPPVVEQPAPAPTPAPSTPPVMPAPPIVMSPPVVYTPPPQPMMPVPQMQPQAPRNSGGAVLVIDNTSGAAPSTESRGGAASGANPWSGSGTTDRARAGMFANRATTVPQGTLIPAVLESGFDSTRPGFARALVQRDIRGFDGSQVLIPRGSRLIGEYRADAAPGQSRAMVIWTRLIRPDGATVALASPASDPVGRGGIKAKVNSHFFERFAGAILQSTLDVGVNLAARSSNSPSIIALPGSFSGASGTLIQPSRISPTLTVARGTSVSVFVARDLDFANIAQP